MTVKKSLCNEIIQVQRLLNGNGEKGMLEKVDDHETMIQQVVGGMKLLKFIGFGTLISIALSILGLLLKK